MYKENKQQSHAHQNIQEYKAKTNKARGPRLHMVAPHSLMQSGIGWMAVGYVKNATPSDRKISVNDLILT
jgi:hypothetical protein